MKESKEKGEEQGKEKREMEGYCAKGRKEEGKDDNFHWMLKAI